MSAMTTLSNNSLKIIFKRLKKLAVALALFGAAGSLSAACSPSAATLCISIDDKADVWINGQSIGSFNITLGGCLASPVCVALTGPQVAALSSAGTNYIAVRNWNSAAGETWASWSLDITCLSGMHSYVTSGSGGF